jgi:hypothetical protein
LRDLIEWGYRECIEVTPLQLEGRLLTLEIEADLEAGFPPVALKDKAKRLREILEQLERERMMADSRKQAIHLIERMPEFQTHMAVLNQVEPPEFRDFLIQDILKGENYG